jgi:hypothetical protein
LSRRRQGAGHHHRHHRRYRQNRLDTLHLATSSGRSNPQQVAFIETLSSPESSVSRTFIPGRSCVVEGMPACPGDDEVTHHLLSAILRSGGQELLRAGPRMSPLLIGLTGSSAYPLGLLRWKAFLRPKGVS